MEQKMKFLWLQIGVNFCDDFDFMVKYCRSNKFEYDIDEGLDWQFIEVKDDDNFYIFEYYHNNLKRLSIEKTINFEEKK